jgi:hypothetical protein
VGNGDAYPPGKFATSFRKDFCSGLECCMTPCLLTGSLQLSPTDCLLGAFIVWLPTFSRSYFGEGFSSSRLTGRALTWPWCLVPALGSFAHLFSLLGQKARTCNHFCVYSASHNLGVLEHVFAGTSESTFRQVCGSSVLSLELSAKYHLGSPIQTLII